MGLFIDYSPLHHEVSPAKAGSSRSLAPGASLRIDGASQRLAKGAVRCHLLDMFYGRGSYLSWKQGVGGGVLAEKKESAGMQECRGEP